MTLSWAEFPKMTCILFFYLFISIYNNLGFYPSFVLTISIVG